MRRNVRSVMHPGFKYLLIILLAAPCTTLGQYDKDDTLKLVKTIEGHLSPKSVGHSGTGKFFAQNMMYRHTINVYDSEYNLLKIIRDKVDLSDFGFEDYGEVKGAPVEVTFSHGGKYAWVSQYTMFGEGFENPGCDACSGDEFDQGYVYKINTESLEIEQVIQAGAVPKFMAVSPDDKYLLVSNWTSGDVSIIDIKAGKEAKRIDVGRHPRGIAIDSRSKKAYVAIMGSDDIAVIDLETFDKTYIADVGRGPRHICIDPTDQYLYVTINNEGKIMQLDLSTEKKTYLKTGRAPRSMSLSVDGQFLYVVNYSSGTVSKVYAPEMELIHSAETKHHPIGITIDEQNNNIWVACYSGSICVYHDPRDKGFTNSLLADNKGFLNYIDEEAPPKEDTERSRGAREPKTKNPTPKTQHPTPNTQYAIIVGAFSVKNNAINLVADLKEKGYEAFTLPTSNGMTYAIAEAYSTEGEAESSLPSIKNKIQPSAWVKEIKN